MMIMNNPNIKSIVLGNNISFYLEKNGDLYACGENEYGQYGIKNFKESYYQFTKIEKKVKSVYSSFKNTIIQKEDGKIYRSHCGLHHNQSNNGFEEIKIEDVVSFSSGEEHSLFLKGNGEVWVMGKNEFGECGFGNEIFESREPKLLMTDKNIISVCCGMNFSVILTRDENQKNFVKDFWG
eukprot:TRINITY_DN5698_c1_g1_i1.p1 TRINITY_DN5698_c1_g1~~TRINITY_DN5698_c1_g1_i1.p1  ORF type:complete len:181 (+),score=40.21 TRINITY_DN5698_c1_g1_i1:220-762(+)